MLNNAMINHKRVLLFQVYAEWRGANSDMRLPLGMLYIGNSLKTNGYPVEVYHIKESEIEAKIKNVNFDDCLFVGVCSIMTGFSLRAAMKLSMCIKEVHREINIVWGGVQPSAIPAECLKKDYVDYVGIGEGEELIVEIARMLEGELDRKDVLGLAYKTDEGDIEINNRRLLITDLDRYHADYSLIDLRNYIFNKYITGLIMSSRGCPYNCAFCYNNYYSNSRWRKHSTEYVVEVLKRLKSQFDFKYFSFSDDNFFVDKKRAFTILEACSSIGLETYCLDIKINGLTEEDIGKLSDLKVQSIFFGTESLNPRLIEKLDKRQTREMVFETVAKFAKCAPNIRVQTEILMALPFESKKELKRDIRDGLKLYRNNKNLSVYFGVLFPLPQTKIMEFVNRNGFCPQELEDYAGIDLNTAWSLCYRWTSFKLSQREIAKIGLIEKYSALLDIRRDRMFKSKGLVPFLEDVKNAFVFQMAKFRLKHWIFLFHQLDTYLWKKRIKITFHKRIMEKRNLKRNIKYAVRKLAKNRGSRDVYVFGTGHFSDYVVRYLQGMNIDPVGFIDNNPLQEGKLKNGKRIIRPVRIENSCVILASLWQDEMHRQLIGLGYRDEDIFRIEQMQKKRIFFNPGSKVSYLNFGYIPGNNLWANIKGKFMGIPNLFKRLQAKDIMKMLELKHDETVLDFGCGSGYITVEMAKVAGKACGIDVVPGIEKIQIPGKLQDKLKYICVRGESLPFDDHSFDVILASEVLPMVEDMSVFLKEIRRVLKPSGRLVIVNGIGRPILKEAYAENSKRLIRLKNKYPAGFPATYHEYELGLQKLFGTGIKKFLSRDEIITQLENHGFVIEIEKQSPSLLYGSYFEWDQFTKYVKNKNLFSTPFFFLKYLFFSFGSVLFKKKYPGGIIFRVKNAEALTK